MTYQEEEQVRLRRQRSKNAIALAMQGRWREAVATNQEIIASFPNDVDAYNRLGRAYIELGDYSSAKEAYGRALELDPYNIIAQKNLRRLSYLGEAVAGSEADSSKAEPQYFIEETGKAGVVALSHLAPRGVLAKMVAGDRVYLKVDDSALAVENSRGEYLGQVEPKHAQRLIKLITGGNQYTAAIVSSAEDRVTVIIREVYQDPSQAGQLSFPPRGVESLHPYLSDKMLRHELEHLETVSDESPEIEGENSESQG
jgi:tetratricopeptide (TPR) repeat protein